MSEFDASLRTLLLSIVGSIVVLFVLWLLLKNTLQSLKRKLFAYILNRMITTMNKRLGHDKEALFAPLWGLQSKEKTDEDDEITLLEIGAGGGANFKYYPRGVNFICVEPNHFFESHVERNISLFPHIKLKKFVVCKGEDMSEVGDGVCDAVVCTLVLCSVDEMDKLLSEVKRILRPGGMFFFLEHVAAAPSSFTYKVQCFLNPVWQFIGEGCNLNRDTWINIDQAGFGEVEYRRFTTTSGMFLIRNFISGTATK